VRWQEVRAAHPDQWLVIEALEAHSENDRRILDRIAVIDVCVRHRDAYPIWKLDRIPDVLVDTGAASTVIGD
jgi:hypothetical protein